MKYSHVIYNSSEKNRSGGVGFGVRSATTGISAQLLAAMEQNGIFSFKDSNVAVSPSALLENPSLIKDTPASYFFQVVPLAQQDNAYVLGRKVAVGFDYTFYMNGRPGRLGNYVVDSYVFPTCPTAEDFEMFLENPAPGSLHFIPSDPSPKADNDEMRSISVGHCPDLEPENAPMKAMESPKLTKKGIALLFAFIQSRKEGKPLLVKSDAKSPAALMASLASVMPQDLMDTITFVTNHNEQGRRPGINIFFINEKYRFEIFPNLWVVLDLLKTDSFESEESALFGPLVEDYAREGNYEGIRKLTGWCLSEVYEKSKSYSKGTQKALFTYVNDYDKFDRSQLATDKDLRTLLQGHFVKHPAEAEKLKGSLQQEFDAIKNREQFESWVEYLFSIEPIDMSALVADNREKINVYAFVNPQAFKAFYERFKPQWDKITKNFLEANQFTSPNHQIYLSEFKDKEWIALYPYFLSNKRDDKKYILKRLLDDGVESEVRESVVCKMELPESRRRVEVILSLMQEHPGEYLRELVPLLADTTRKLGNDAMDYFAIFPNEIGNASYAPLYACTLEMTGLNSPENVRKFIDNLQKMYQNPLADGWLNGDGGKNVLNILFRRIIELVASNRISDSEGLKISEIVLKGSISRASRHYFENLSAALSHSRDVNTGNVGEIWKIAEDLGDKQYLKSLVGTYLRDIESREPEMLYSSESRGRASKGVVDYLIDKGYATEDEILDIALHSQKKKFYFKAFLERIKGDPQAQLDYLVDKAHLSKEDALSFLERQFPDSYKKLTKVSLISKIMGLFKKKSDKEDGSNPKPPVGKVSESKPLGSKINKRR